MKIVKNGDKYQKMSNLNMLNRGESKLNVKKIIIILLIIIGIAFIGGFIFDCYKYSRRADIKIPILLYHNFVTEVPNSDQDDFKYINTPESFEENIKTFLDNGYTIISIKELADADKGKTELPNKPIIITFDDGYYSNYEYIYPI